MPATGARPPPTKRMEWVNRILEGEGGRRMALTDAVAWVSLFFGTPPRPKKPTLPTSPSAVWKVGAAAYRRAQVFDHSQWIKRGNCTPPLAASVDGPQDARRLGVVQHEVPQQVILRRARLGKVPGVCTG